MHYDEVLTEQQERWISGDHVAAEELLQQYRAAFPDSDSILDLVYREVLLREEFGEQPLEAEYLERFPELADAIARQFQVHRALNAADVPQAEVPTAAGGVTLQRDPLPQDRGVDASGPLRIPGFELIEIAGRGGSGIAYRARDTTLNRTVAIKVLPVSADSAEAQSQLLREAKAAASLVHQGIVRIHQVGEVSGSPFLVMEFLEGGSLADLLRDGPLAVEEAVRISHCVAEAIQFAHEQGVIHRDLKPGNVLLDAERNPQVCDFGLARKLDAEQTMHATGDVLGTPAYMPPEQARGDRADERSDVYSLGAILYETLGGRSPFQAATPWEILHQVLTSDPPALRQLNASVPQDLETICQRCLEKNPEQRYSSAKEVAEELERFRNGQPIHAQPIGAFRRFGKWCRRHPSLAALSAVTTVSLIAIAIVSALSAQRVSEALAETQDALRDVEAQRDVAVTAMNDLVHGVHDDLTKREASVEARGQVLLSAMNGLQKIIDEVGDREDTRRAMITAKIRYGYILYQQGQHDEAETEMLTAIDLAESIPGDDARRLTTECYKDLTQLYAAMAHYDDVEATALRTLDVARPLAERHPEDIEIQQTIAHAQLSLAKVAAGRATDTDYSEAVTQGGKAREIVRPIAEAQPDDADISEQLIEIDQFIARHLLASGRIRESGPYLREALDVIQRRDPESSEDQQLRNDYYTALADLATVRTAEMKLDEADQSLQAVVAGYRRMIKSEPERGGFRLKMTDLCVRKAICSLALNRLDDAAAEFEETIEHCLLGVELLGPNFEVQKAYVAQSKASLADSALCSGDIDAAANGLQEAVDILSPIVEAFPQFQLEPMLNGIQEQSEVARQLQQAVESDADDESDAAALKRAYHVWRASLQGDVADFVEQETQLRIDIEAAESTTVRHALQRFLAMSCGNWHASLSDAEPPDETALSDAENKCIEALKLVALQPDADPLFHVNVPDFRSLRTSETFRQAFPVP